MRSFLTILACAALGVMTGAQPSQAEITYAWCAQYAMQGSSNCGFSTLDQCRAALSGNGGYCDRNPMFHSPAQGAAAPRERR